MLCIENAFIHRLDITMYKTGLAVMWEAFFEWIYSFNNFRIAFLFMLLHVWRFDFFTKCNCKCHIHILISGWANHTSKFLFHCLLPMCRAQCTFVLCFIFKRLFKVKLFHKLLNAWWPCFVGLFIFSGLLRVPRKYCTKIK